MRDEVRTLVDFDFNDRAGSLIVYSGQWEFCQHADFRGQCMVYGPGRYDRLGSLDNQISSIRRVR
ncbi:beta/gamma crystallin family protein [Massilia sp. B-10]|nr:beta/gamma crystallin family protein [Massilia sp. B-10]